MTLRAVLASIRRNWIVVVVAVVACTLAGLALTYVLPKTYSTSTQVLFQPQASGTDAELPDSASSYVSTQMPTIAALATTASVLEPAARDLGNIDAISLKDHVSASIVADTSIVAIRADAATGEQAARIANAVSSALVAQAKAVQPDLPMTLAGEVVEAPIVPPYPDSPLLLVDLLIGFLVGLLVAFLAVVARESLRASGEVVREPVRAPVVAREPLRAPAPIEG